MATTVSFLCCLLGLLAVTSAFIRSDNTDEEVTKGNELMDRIIEILHEKYVEDYDPYYSERSIFRFAKQLLFFNVTAELQVNGSMVGLKTLQRSGASSLKRKGEIGYLNGVWSVQNLGFLYAGVITFMNWKHEVTAECKCDYVELSIAMNFCVYDGRDGQVSDFHVNEVREPKCKISGFGSMLGDFLGAAIDKMGTLSEHVIRACLTKQVFPRLAEIVANHDFPVEDIDFTSDEK